MTVARLFEARWLQFGLRTGILPVRTCGIGISLTLVVQFVEEVYQMTLHGRVENGVVVFQNDARLPDGMLVEVTPLHSETGRPGTVPVSKERQEALLGLIGIWKTEHPPSDEEVEQIIEEYRMKKYG